MYELWTQRHMHGKCVCTQGNSTFTADWRQGPFVVEGDGYSLYSKVIKLIYMTCFLILSPEGL